MVKWSINSIGNTASTTDSSEMAWIEANNETGRYDIVYQARGRKTAIDSAKTEPEARIKLRSFVKNSGEGT